MKNTDLILDTPKYNEIVSKLGEKIRKGEIEGVLIHSEDFGKDYACLICLEKIIGNMRIITETGKIREKKAIIKYPLHERCYNSLKYFQYIDHVPISLN